MPRQEDVLGFGATRFVIGLSSIFEVNLKTVPYAVSGQFKLLAGLTLEIVSGVSAGSDPASHRGTGYPIGTNEIISVGGASRYYLCASGATGIISMLIGKSESEL